MEDRIRQDAAAHIDLDKSLKRQQALLEIAQKTNRPLSEEETGLIRQMLVKRDTDPKSVFEEYYSNSS